MKDDIKRNDVRKQEDTQCQENTMIEKANSIQLAQMAEDYNNNKKKEDSNVLKDALDSRLMLAKAIKAGTKVIKAQGVN